MNTADIIKYLDKRIARLNGGDELKSMNESFCDDRIVSELVDVRNFIINNDKPKRNVGVISLTVEKFLEWKKEHGYKNEKPGSTYRKFTVDNTTYICLSRPEHACGYSFDEITRTDGAYLNKDFDKIVDYCRAAMNKGGKWDL